MMESSKMKRSYFKDLAMQKKVPEEFVGFFWAVISWSASFVAPISHFIVLIFFLVLFDMATGIRASRKMRNEKIHSSGLRRTIEKFTLYCVALLSAEGMRIVFFTAIPVAVPLTTLVAFVIAYTEYKSVNENIEIVTGAGVWSYLKGRVKIK